MIDSKKQEQLKEKLIGNPNSRGSTNSSYGGSIHHNSHSIWQMPTKSTGTTSDEETKDGNNDQKSNQNSEIINALIQASRSTDENTATSDHSPNGNSAVPYMEKLFGGSRNVSIHVKEPSGHMKRLANNTSTDDDGQAEEKTPRCCGCFQR